MKKYSDIDLLFKEAQKSLLKKDTFQEGLLLLLTLRKKLMDLDDPTSFESTIWEKEADISFTEIRLKKEKTIAYYLFHLARIEDITANVLLANREQIFFKGNYPKRLNTSLWTTGNELNMEEIVSFSQDLNLQELKAYRREVYQNTNLIMQSLDYATAKRKVDPENIAKVIAKKSISEKETAIWLLDYWGSKNFIGLMLMPFSRHQMQHLNACQRIIAKN